MNCLICNQEIKGGGCLGKVVPAGLNGFKALALVPWEEKYVSKTGVVPFCSFKCGLAGVERVFQTGSLDRPRSENLPEPVAVTPEEGGWRLDD